ncbi:cytochrome P450 [Mycobacterium sp. NPDC051804]|uniref:cytochrome P450 n=1 Tax=Mycobacterium sp. NPDC051804 TaxID=3364295 RepID=UPI0037A5FCB3
MVIAKLVDETVRYLSVVQSLVDRVVLEDMTIGGQQVQAGDILLMNIPAGNWDPRFTEHRIGLKLARAELQIALFSLARRMPDLRLAVPREQLEFKSDHGIYGIRDRTCLTD